MSEWLKEHAWKVCILRKWYRGFESLSLRNKKAEHEVLGFFHRSNRSLLRVWTMKKAKAPLKAARLSCCRFSSLGTFRGTRNESQPQKFVPKNRSLLQVWMMKKAKVPLKAARLSCCRVSSLGSFRGTRNESQIIFAEMKILFRI